MYQKCCPHCSQVFETKDKNQKHCSKTCSTTRNNTLVPRKHVKQFKRPKKLNEADFICSCGSVRTYRSKFCFNCNKLQRIYKYEEQTLDQIKIATPQSAFVKVRQHANRKFKALNIPLQCKICGYDTYLELAHIKPISSFEGQTKLQEVNHINNLAYLCPNHHKELDNGIISIAETK